MEKRGWNRDVVLPSIIAATLLELPSVKTLLECPHCNSGENVPVRFVNLLHQAAAAVGKPERSDG